MEGTLFTTVICTACDKQSDISDAEKIGKILETRIQENTIGFLYK